LKMRQEKETWKSLHEYPLILSLQRPWFKVKPYSNMIPDQRHLKVSGEYGKELPKG